MGLVEVGAGDPLSDKQEATFIMKFDVGCEDYFEPTLRLTQLVDRRDNATFGELKEQAKEFALAAMRIAIETLEKHTLEELQQITADQDKAADLKAEADFKISAKSRFVGGGDIVSPAQKPD